MITFYLIRIKYAIINGQTSNTRQQQKEWTTKTKQWQTVDDNFTEILSHAHTYTHNSIQFVVHVCTHIEASHPWCVHGWLFVWLDGWMDG